MAENSGIQWTTHTFNPWRGCTKVSPGCAHCYAETLSGRNPKVLGKWGSKGTRVVAAEAMWREPVKWNRVVSCNVAHGGPRPRVFCASLADVFEDWQGPMVGSHGDVVSHDSGDPPWRELGAGRRITMQDVRNRLFRLIDTTPHLDWLVLTKRPENIERMMPDYLPCHCRVPEMEGAGLHSPLCDVFKVRPNLWLGTSIENQQAADERIPHLLRVPAAVRFLSVEPLLGPVDLTAIGHGDQRGLNALSGEFCWYDEDTGDLRSEWGPAITWVIVGGESGRGARPCRVEWIRSIVKQCKAAGVPVFVKQLGADPQVETVHGDRPPGLIHLPLTLRDKKGGDMAEWPADLQVREFPCSPSAS